MQRVDCGERVGVGDGAVVGGCLESKGDNECAPPTSAPSLAERIETLEHFLCEPKNASLFAGRQHRDKRFRRVLSLRSSFKVGTGSTQIGHLPLVARGVDGFVRHQFRNTGVCVKPVHSQRISKKHKRVYDLAAAIVQLVDPWFAAGDYNVQFALMDDPDSHRVAKHRDSQDVCYQYALALGDFAGAKLRVYDVRGASSSYTDFANRGRIVKFDGRCPHEVVFDGFVGKRFSVVFYKNYDRRIASAPCPLFGPPEWAY